MYFVETAKMILNSGKCKTLCGFENIINLTKTSYLSLPKKNLVKQFQYHCKDTFNINMDTLLKIDISNENNNIDISLYSLYYYINNGNELKVKIIKQ